MLETGTLLSFLGETIVPESAYFTSSIFDANIFAEEEKCSELIP